MILTYQKNHLFLAGGSVSCPLELWFSLFAMPRFSASNLFLHRRDCKVELKTQAPYVIMLEETTMFADVK
jgi:hypothetical protein